MRGLAAAVIGILIGTGLAVLALRGGGAPPTDAAADPAAGDGRPPLRIASLSPALTRAAVDLGLEPHVVGRSTFCTAVPVSVPVVGDLRQIDLERLVRLDPTHVLVQPPAGGVDGALRDLADRRGWRIVAIEALDDLDDVRELVRTLPLAIFDAGDGGATPVAELPVAELPVAELPVADLPLADPRRTAALRAGRRILDRLDAAFDASAAEAAGRFTGAVLLVHDADRVGAFGRGTWLSDAVIELGATNAVLQRGWPTLSLEDVARLDPEAIVLVSADADDPRPVADRLGPLATLDVAAVRDGRLAVVAHPEALLPSSSAVEVIDRLAGALERVAAAGSPSVPSTP